MFCESFRLKLYQKVTYRSTSIHLLVKYVTFYDICINSFSAKQFIIITTGKAPSLLGVATTKVRFLGI